ncbi:MAG: HEAT repeat domain-containing protein [Planctomycetota bacterium]
MGETAVLGWEIWWNRHQWAYAVPPKHRSRITGMEGGNAVANPQLHVLVDFLCQSLTDDHREIRASAAIALGKIRWNEAPIRSALLKALKDRDRTVRATAALALGMIGAKETGPRLAAILKNKRNDSGFRSFAAVSLGLMGDPANLRVLQTTFHAPDSKSDVKGGAILGLGLLGQERAVYTLLPVFLRTMREEFRALAVTSLARLGMVEICLGSGKKAVTLDLIQEFEKRLLDKRTPREVRRAIALALGTFGREQTSRSVLQKAYWRDRDKGVRGFALLSIAQLGKKSEEKGRSLRFLSWALSRETSPLLRGYLALGLGLTEEAEAGPLLLDLFQGKEHPDVRAAAAVGLGIVKYRAALPDLGREIQDPKDAGKARGYAAMALGMIGDPASVPYLRAVLENANIPYLRWAASNGLALLGDRTAVPALLKSMGDRNLLTRRTTIQALRFFRDETSIEPLLACFRKEKVDVLRRSIIGTLGAIGEPVKGIPALRRIDRHVNWMAAIRLKSIALLLDLF